MVASGYERQLNNLRRKLDAHDAAMIQRRSRAREAAPRIAGLLRAQFGAGRVWLVGSAIIGRSFGPGSDIDLLVEGLSPAVYLKALTTAESLTGGEFPVDLIRLEDLEPESRALFLGKATLL